MWLKDGLLIIKSFLISKNFFLWIDILKLLSQLEASS